MTAPVKLQFADLEAVGPGTPAGRYLRLFWQPLIRAKELKAGEAKPVEMLGEKFTVYRGASGEAHVVEYRCAHRACPLTLGWVEGDAIRCRYHGWRFDATGQCVEQPAEERPFAQRIKIKSYPAREYCGLDLRLSRRGRGAGLPHLSRFRQARRHRHRPAGDPARHLLEQARQRPRARAVGASRDRHPQGPRRLPRHPQGGWCEETEYGWRSTRSVKDQELTLTEIAHFFMPNARQFWGRTRAKGFEGRNLLDTKMTWTVPVNDGAFVSFDVTHTPLTGEEGAGATRPRATPSRRRRPRRAGTSRTR